METTLHRQLKAHYGASDPLRTEVAVDGYRIDAIGDEGDLVEVQSASLGPLKGKLARLLARHEVRVVKPVVLAKWVVRRARRDGADLGSRRSPRRGAMLDAFEDLVGLARVFPHANLRIDVVGVEVDEVRVPRRRRPGHAVVDRRLRAVVATTTLRSPADLWSLLPGPTPPGPFTTRDLAAWLGRPEPFARRVAYCLRHADAAEVVGKAGNARIYRMREAGTPAAAGP